MICGDMEQWLARSADVNTDRLAIIRKLITRPESTIAGKLQHDFSAASCKASSS